MKKVYVLLAEGFEEVEALTPVDLLRRAGVEVVVVSTTQDKIVTGARGIRVDSDAFLSDIDESADILMLPGGIPGVPNLKANPAVIDMINRYVANGKYLAAICAGPSIPGEMGLLEGQIATVYPGMEDTLKGACWAGKDVTVAVSEQFITSRGVGTVIDFALKMIEILVSKEKADQIASAIVYR